VAAEVPYRWAGWKVPRNWIVVNVYPSSGCCMSSESSKGFLAAVQAGLKLLLNSLCRNVPLL